MTNEIIRLEEELRLAMLQSNVAQLNKLIADALVFILPDGSSATKAMDLEAHRSGMQHLTLLSPSDRTISTFGHGATVSVIIDLEGTYGGQSISGRYRYLRVWAKTADGFQLVAGAVTPIR